jgi:hypothetical protein
MGTNTPGSRIANALLKEYRTGVYAFPHSASKAACRESVTKFRNPNSIFPALLLPDPEPWYALS